MNTEPNKKFHVFFQDSTSRLYKYFTGKYTKEEVDQIIKLLPPDHKALRIVWQDIEWPEWHPGNPKNRELNNTNENGDN